MLIPAFHRFHCIHYTPTYYAPLTIPQIISPTTLNMPCSILITILLSSANHLTTSYTRQSNPFNTLPLSSPQPPHWGPTNQTTSNHLLYGPSAICPQFALPIHCHGVAYVYLDFSSFLLIILCGLLSHALSP